MGSTLLPLIFWKLPFWLDWEPTLLSLGFLSLSAGLEASVHGLQKPSRQRDKRAQHKKTWEFPCIRIPVCGAPYEKGPAIWGLSQGLASTS